ncbi:MAG: hypothetical protein NTV06_08220 [candidate division Zixibacteria bacterium]|nr:hypothetical protein [candidate division Zixibacteria bacterium]
MKKIITAIVIICVTFSVTMAKKKDLAGEVVQGVYVDSIYDFSLNVPEAWNYTVKKASSNVRVILSKKQYDIPIQFQEASNYTLVPKITVYVDSTSLAMDQFLDSLLSNAYKSKQKNNILSELKILNGNFQLKKRAKMTMGELSGFRVEGQLRYTLEVQRSGSESDKGDIVADFYGGSIFFVKNGNTIVMIHFISEWRYFDVLDQDFTRILETFKFLKK